MTMGRLKIRNTFLHFREMRVAFLWESGKKLNVRKRISNFRPDYPLLLQPCTVTNTFAKGCEVLFFRFSKVTTCSDFPGVCPPRSAQQRLVLTFLALSFFLMSPFWGTRCNSQCQEDHSFTGD